MALDCGACLTKYLLCLFNFIFFIAGSVVLGVGIWLAVDKNSFVLITKISQNENLQQFTQPTAIEQASYILIAAGGFIFVVSFLGYCGALRESRFLLTAYGICLLVILVMEITAGGLAAAYRSEAEAKTKDLWKSTIRNYYATKDKADAVTLMWDYLMSQLQCCGVDSYKDFEESEKWKEGGKVVPESCCVLKGDPTAFEPKDSNCPSNPSDSNSYYMKGCYQRVKDWVAEHTNVVIGVGIGLGLVQLLAIILAFCLCKAIDGHIK